MGSALYGFNVQLNNARFDDAVARVTDALKTEGFGVLTEIDVQKTLKEKLGIDGRSYRILGTCNPPLAHRALTAEPDICLLLPMQRYRARGGRQNGDRRLHGPDCSAAADDNPEVATIAHEVRAQLERVRDRLAAMGGGS